MAKATDKLGALEISRLTKPGRHRVSKGLYVQVNGDGRSWIFRYMFQGRSREMGLGSCAQVTLADARLKISKLTSDMRSTTAPVDPKLARDESKKQLRHTFADAAAGWLQKQNATWRKQKQRNDVRRLVETRCKSIWGLPVASIGKEEIKSIIGPVITEKVVTGRRLVMYVAAILDYAMAADWRAEGLNPSRWKGNLDKLYNAQKSDAIKHFDAVPWRDVPALAAELRRVNSIAARALEWQLLCTCRPGNALRCRKADIDLTERIWTIPKHESKNGDALRIPLSARAVEIARQCWGHEGDLLFPGARKGVPMRREGPAKVLRSLHATADCHGLRSSFRSWCEWHKKPWNAAEMQLGHRVGTVTERVYQQEDLLDARRELVEQWSDFVTTPPAATESAKIFQSAHRLNPLHHK